MYVSCTAFVLEIVRICDLDELLEHASRGDLIEAFRQNNVVGAVSVGLG